MNKFIMPDMTQHMRSEGYFGELNNSVFDHYPNMLGIHLFSISINMCPRSIRHVGFLLKEELLKENFENWG